MSTRPRQGSPPATASEHMRPPIDRPPRNTSAGDTPAWAESRAASAITASISTGALSGARRPDLRYGKSILATETPSAVKASSMATRVEWSRSAPAPGASTNPTGRALGLSTLSPGPATPVPSVPEEDALGLRQLGDAPPGPLARTAVVGVSVADEAAERLQDLAAGRLGVGCEPQDLERPVF